MRAVVVFLGCVLITSACVAVTVTQSVAIVHAAATTTTALESQISANEQAVVQLTQEIATYQAELQKVGADKQTLQSAIDALNLKRRTVETQIAVIERQVGTTQIELRQIGTGIADTQQAIATDQADLADDIRNLDDNDNESLVVQLLSSDTFAQVWDDSAALLQLQNAIQDKVQALQAEKDSLTSSQAASRQKQNLLVSQQQSLTAQQASLVQTQKSQAQLLAETNQQEATYQRLLAQAKSELAGFSAFARNAGGTGLLSNQTSCDAWGCYYNQRDTAWGDDALNSTQYLLKSDGCLVTAMAMVMTHYGYRDVTPVTINSDPNNFAAYFPAYLLLTIHVDGATVVRETAAIDAVLATGNPVVVGLYAYGGTHFVVIVSGSRGDYIMRDPYIPNGNDISFTAHYSLRNIFSIAKVVVQ